MDVPFWGPDVWGFGYSYDAEDDVVVIIPQDSEGGSLEEGTIAVSASVFGDFLDKLKTDYSSIMNIRRRVRKGKEKGIDPEVVQSRFRAQVMADEWDTFLRRESVSGKAN